MRERVKMLEKFLNKRVRLVRKSNRFKFVGTIENIDEKGLLLNDRIDGMIYVPLDDILEMIEEKEE